MRSDRLKTSFDAFYSAGREEGMGRLADVSISGALLEGANSRPRVGSMLQIKVLRPKSPPIELEAEVVRHSPNGFGVQFKRFTAQLGDLIADLERKG
jgi:hypothetical protein